jgi:hypothetical protein
VTPDIPARRPVVRAPLIVAIAVIVLVGTVGSFAVGFGVLTDCTNLYSCTRTACGPCRPAGEWLTTGWAAQGVLLLGGLVLVVLARRGVRPRVVRAAALALTVLSIAVLVTTTVLARQSY